MKRIFFIEMMGEPGSYDASVYDHLPDRDLEGRWFVKRFGRVPGIHISTRNVCIGDPLPQPGEVDGLVLAGTYNSVHDYTHWQQQVRAWMPQMKRHEIPTLAICGSHQLLCHVNGAAVEWNAGGPYAGTFPVQMTDAGRASPIMEGIEQNAGFQFANSEQVTEVPKGSTLLASSGEVAVAALDFGDHWYSTQFHPEGTHETLGTVWRHKAPEKMQRYYPEENGRKLVENFLRLVTTL